MNGRIFERLIIALGAAMLAACAATKPPPVEGHLTVPPADGTATPPPVVSRPFVPPPQAPKREETYTVVVNDVPVKELLFALSRDANVNVDIHPLVSGNVTINAVNQTLIQILNRVADQVSLTYELQGQNLFISPDIPFWRGYKIDYFNLTRASSSSTGVATSIATTGGSISGGSTEQGNKSQTTVTTEVVSEFWKTITNNLEFLLRDPSTGEAISGETAQVSGNIVVNASAGVVNVRGTQRQHREVQRFVDSVVTNTKRQVLIEATIVEVELGDHYQAGIDWSVVNKTGGPRVDANGNVITRPDSDGNPIAVPDKLIAAGASVLGGNLATAPTFLLGYDRVSSDKDITATVRFLETFGDAKVLSSPKIMALNNQTALLKVVDEKVYFNIDLEIEKDTETGREINRTYTSEILTVPVGMVMSVTPQISDAGLIGLNVRPTITRITGYAVDPTPKLLGADFDNLVPEIQVREMESVLQVASGQTVVLGGLMQNKQDKNDSGVPYLSTLPIVGNLFKYKDDQFTKTELVIFLRPVLVSDTMDSKEWDKWRGFLPGEQGGKTDQSMSDARGW